MDRSTSADSPREPGATGRIRAPTLHDVGSAANKAAHLPGDMTMAAVHGVGKILSRVPKLIHFDAFRGKGVDFFALVAGHAHKNESIDDAEEAPPAGCWARLCGAGGSDATPRAESGKATLVVDNPLTITETHHVESGTGGHHFTHAKGTIAFIVTGPSGTLTALVASRAARVLLACGACIPLARAYS